MLPGSIVYDASQSAPELALKHANTCGRINVTLHYGVINVFQLGKPQLSD